MNRDDLPSLPIPRSAKSYLRRKGVDAMKPGKQPAAYSKMVADVTHQPIKGFKNRDVSRTTAGAVIEAFLSEARPTMAQNHRQASANNKQQPQRQSSTIDADLEQWEWDFLGKFTKDRVATMAEVPKDLNLAVSTRYPYGVKGSRPYLPPTLTEVVWGATVAKWLSEGKCATLHELEQQLSGNAQQPKQGARNSAMQLPPWWPDGGKAGVGKPLDIPERRLTDAINAATKAIKDRAKYIKKGLTSDKQNAYVAYLRANDTGAVQAKFTQRLAGADTKEQWVPLTDNNGNQTGNHSAKGYTLEVYGWNTGEKPGTVWDKVNKVGSNVKGFTDKWGGKAADLIRKAYGV